MFKIGDIVSFNSGDVEWAEIIDIRGDKVQVRYKGQDEKEARDNNSFWSATFFRLRDSKPLGK